MSETQAPYSRPAAAEEREAYVKLREVFSLGQIVQITSLLGRLVERSLERGCDQSLTITIKNGHPRWLQGSDNVEFEKP